jgi:hypothetical protein
MSTFREKRKSREKEREKAAKKGRERRKGEEGGRGEKNIPKVSNLVADALFVDGASLLVVVGLDAANVVRVACKQCGDQSIHGGLY